MPTYRRIQLVILTMVALSQFKHDQEATLINVGNGSDMAQRSLIDQKVKVIAQPGSLELKCLAQIQMKATIGCAAFIGSAVKIPALLGSLPMISFRQPDTKMRLPLGVSVPSQLSGRSITHQQLIDLTIWIWSENIGAMKGVL
jgi:hypothetical protein